MTTITVGPGQTSEAVAVGAFSRITLAGNGRIEYSANSLADARNGLATWATWPLGTTAGSTDTVRPMLVRLVGLRAASMQIDEGKGLLIPPGAYWNRDIAVRPTSSSITVRGMTAVLPRLTGQDTFYVALPAGVTTTLDLPPGSDKTFSIFDIFLTKGDASSDFALNGFVVDGTIPALGANAGDMLILRGYTLDGAVTCHLQGTPATGIGTSMIPARPTPGTTFASSSPVASPQTDADVIWVNATFTSAILGQTAGLCLMLPADYYRTTQDYPVVWNMHGLSQTGVNEGYIAASHPGVYGAAVRARTVRPHITVFPSGCNWSMWMNNFDGSLRIEQYIMQEVIPWVRANYRARTDRNSNVCSDFSMGSRAALYYAFKYPDVFAGAHAYGPPVADDSYDFAGDSVVANWGPYVLSPGGDYTTKERARWKACSPQGWLTAFSVKPKLRVVYGASDPNRTVGNTFKTLLTSNGIAFDTVADLAGVAHVASAYWTNADAQNAFAFYERCFAGA